MEYQIFNYVYLKVTPFMGTKRFQVKGKLAPRYVGPFPIYTKRAEVEYALALPDSLLGIHDVLHASQLNPSAYRPTPVARH
jgi:hypothetical protein